MDEIIEFLENQHWIFAKTYAETAPHEYCLKEKVVCYCSSPYTAKVLIEKYGFQTVRTFPNGTVHVKLKRK